jgi:DNA topoisomerase-1
MLDRIIGFRLSYITNKKLKASSAGRVKSSVLKLIIDRENEIKSFKKDY